MSASGSTTASAATSTRAASARINNQAVVILKNRTRDVYGTGLHFRSAAATCSTTTEVRVTFTLQSLDADLTPMGDIGASKLYGQYPDYQSFGIDFGFRRYVDVRTEVRAYGEGASALAFVDETDVDARWRRPPTCRATPPTSTTGRPRSPWGQRRHACSSVAEQVGVYGQIGLRYVTGMSEVDGLAGTGLETINDKSARWTVPFIAGVRVRFSESAGPRVAILTLFVVFGGGARDRASAQAPASNDTKVRMLNPLLWCRRYRPTSTCRRFRRAGRAR